jgi:DNA-binding MarR family transcriptional regulator
MIESHKDILLALEANNTQGSFLSSSDLAWILNRMQATVVTHLKDLERQGYVRRLGLAGPWAVVRRADGSKVRITL